MGFRRAFVCTALFGARVVKLTALGLVSRVVRSPERPVVELSFDDSSGTKLGRLKVDRPGSVREECCFLTPHQAFVWLNQFSAEELHWADRYFLKMMIEAADLPDLPND